MLKESLDLQENIKSPSISQTEGAASELYLEQLNRVSETNGT